MEARSKEGLERRNRTLRNTLFWACLLCAGLLTGTAAQAQFACDPTSDEPFIRFLDDLSCFPFGKGERDPYEERIETERHDYTQSTKTVGRGVFQVESGYLYSYKDADDEIEHSHATPEVLLRMGLSDDIEFRLRWNYIWKTLDEEAFEEGAADLIWSFKLQVTEQDGWIPESAVEIRSSVPTGGSDFSLGRVEAGFDYIYSWKLYEEWSLYGSTAVLPGGLGEASIIPEEQESDHFTVFGQSAAVGAELTEQNTFYAEWFGLSSQGLEDEFVQSFFNIGVDHYFTDDFLIDFRVGVGLTGDSEDFFAGVGGGFRF